MGQAFCLGKAVERSTDIPGSITCLGCVYHTIERFVLPADQPARSGNEFAGHVGCFPELLLGIIGRPDQSGEPSDRNDISISGWHPGEIYPRGNRMDRQNSRRFSVYTLALFTLLAARYLDLHGCVLFPARYETSDPEICDHGIVRIGAVSRPILARTRIQCIQLLRFGCGTGTMPDPDQPGNDNHDRLRRQSVYQHGRSGSGILICPWAI